MSQKNSRDTIVAEVRAARESIFARFRYDLDKVAQYFSEREESSGDHVVQPQSLPKEPSSPVILPAATTASAQSGVGVPGQ